MGHFRLIDHKDQLTGSVSGFILTKIVRFLRLHIVKEPIRSGCRPDSDSVTSFCSKNIKLLQQLLFDYKIPDKWRGNFDVHRLMLPDWKFFNGILRLLQ
jgi:hypothetical protein